MRQTQELQIGIGRGSSQFPQSGELSTRIIGEGDPISRYIPTDTKAFLVEDHRLTTREKVSQKVSSVFPWILLSVFATAPFFVMKYNLEKLESISKPAESPVVTRISRPHFRRILFADIPDILQRRVPSLVTMLDESFHSQVLVLLFLELDSLFEKYKIDTAVCALPYSSVTPEFRAQYPTAPQCQLVKPADGTVIDFQDSWNARNVVEFVIPRTQITDPMAADIAEIESKVQQFRKCLFLKRFIEKKPWTVSDSLDSDSVDSALVRCASL